MEKRVMIAVYPETKRKFRNIDFPDYITTDDNRIKWLIAQLRR